MTILPVFTKMGEQTVGICRAIVKPGHAHWANAQVSLPIREGGSPKLAHGVPNGADAKVSLIRPSETKEIDP